MTDPATFDFATLLANADAPLMLAIFIGALLRGWLVLPREIETHEKRVADRDKRITELEGERDEFKQMAFRALNVGERVTAAAEERGRL